MRGSTLCSLVFFVGVLLVIETDLDKGSLVDRLRVASRNFCCIVIEECYIPNAQKRCSAPIGDVGVFTASACKEKRGR